MTQVHVGSHTENHNHSIKSLSLLGIFFDWSLAVQRGLLVKFNQIPRLDKMELGFSIFLDPGYRILCGGWSWNKNF